MRSSTSTPSQTSAARRLRIRRSDRRAVVHPRRQARGRKRHRRRELSSGAGLLPASDVAASRPRTPWPELHREPGLPASSGRGYAVPIQLLAADPRGARWSVVSAARVTNAPRRGRYLHLPRQPVAGPELPRVPGRRQSGAEDQPLADRPRPALADRQSIRWAASFPPRSTKRRVAEVSRCFIVSQGQFLYGRPFRTTQLATCYETKGIGLGPCHPSIAPRTATMHAEIWHRIVPGQRSNLA